MTYMATYMAVSMAVVGLAGLNVRVVVSLGREGVVVRGPHPGHPL